VKYGRKRIIYYSYRLCFSSRNELPRDITTQTKKQKTGSYVSFIFYFSPPICMSEWCKALYPPDTLEHLLDVVLQEVLVHLLVTPRLLPSVANSGLMFSGQIIPKIRPMSNKLTRHFNSVNNLL
jgi:hypothetical protein